MATINYNGMELEILEPQIFDYPKTCVVWDIDNPSPNGFSVKQVLAVLPMSFRKDAGIKPVITNDRTQWNFCAILPDPPKPRRATWLEVARWCATGNGLVYDIYRDKIDTGIMFKSFDGDEPIMDEIKVRKWSDTEWHEPTVDYLFGGDK
jgi:hypothetical protein